MRRLLLVSSVSHHPVTLVVLVVGVFAMASGNAIAEKRVQPHALPSQPTQSEEVKLRFRTRQTLDGTYHAQARHVPVESGCDARRSRDVIAPRKGRVVRLRLLAPRVVGQPDVGRWCIGTYRVKVFFKQTVSCEPPLQCGDSVARAIGATTFTVVADD